MSDLGFPPISREGFPSSVRHTLHPRGEVQCSTIHNYRGGWIERLIQGDMGPPPGSAPLETWSLIDVFSLRGVPVSDVVTKAQQLPCLDALDSHTVKNALNLDD